MKFIDLDIDAYCKKHTPKLSRILDCIDSEMRIRGCGACLADLSRCCANDDSPVNIKKFLSFWQSMAIHINAEVFNEYSVEEANDIFAKYAKLYKKVYRYHGLVIPNDPYFHGIAKLVGCTSLITYPASCIDVDYFTNCKPLPLDILEMLRQDGLRLKDVDDQTEEYCKAAISNNGLALQYVKNKTYELCWQAVGMNGYALEFCHDQTEELCVRAVRQKGMALRFVKEQTPFVCLVAIEKNVNALQFVHRQTPKMCMAAVKRHGKALQYVRRQTNAICLAAVRSWGKALEFVKNKTPKIYAEAVRQSREAFPFVEIRDEKSAINVLKHDWDGELLPSIPFRSESFLRKAVALSPESIRHIEQTPELCMIAVKNNGYTIRHMEQTPELSWAALIQNESAIEYIDNPTYEMQLHVVMREGWYFQDFQEQTMELCAAAYLQRRSNIQYIRDKSITEEKIEEYLNTNQDLCRKMVPFSSRALKYVKRQTRKLCLQAVTHDGYALQYVRNQTPEIQYDAVENDGLAIQFIPPGQQTSELIRVAFLSRPLEFCQFYFDDEKFNGLTNMPARERFLSIIKNKKLWLAVLAKDARLLEYCPILTYNICLTAVSHSANAFRYVPEKFRTKEIVKLALAGNPRNIQYVKKQTRQLCLEILESYLAKALKNCEFPNFQRLRYKIGIGCIRDPKLREEISEIFKSRYMYEHLI